LEIGDWDLFGSWNLGFGISKSAIPEDDLLPIHPLVVVIYIYEQI
jgi:hypothetical protein